MDDHGRLIMAELGAEVLIADLKEIVNHTDNLPLKELMADELKSVEKLRRRLQRFAKDQERD